MSGGLVVASNRGPVEWQRGVDGALVARRGFGGLVTALCGALAQEPGREPVTWVSVALSDVDREVAGAHRGASFEQGVGGARFRLRLVDLGDRFPGYYEQVSNRLLWFTLHGL